MSPRVHRRLLSLNVHVGQSIRNGTLAELIERQDPDAMVLQEVRPRDKPALRELLGRRWGVRGVQDSVVCWHRDAYRLLDSVSPDVTMGERYDRNATRVLLCDRAARRPLSLASVHVQPLGKGLADAHPGARRRQTRQLDVWVDQATEVPARAVVIDGGDFNQDMDRRWPRAVRKHAAATLWARAGMVAAHTLVRRPGRVYLDEFMVRPDEHVEVLGRRVVDTTRPGDDHPAIVLDVEVAPS